YGPYSSPYLLSLLGQKYRLTLKTFEENLASYSRKIFEIGNINVYINPYYVPIGATYDQWINESELDGKRTFEIEAGLIKYCVIDDSDSANFNIFTKKSSPLFEDNYQLNDFTTDIGLLKKDTLTISLFSPNRIEGNILLEKPKILFFSIPFDDGWTLLVDNIEYPFYRINFGFIGTPLRQGFHTIQIKYFPPHFKIGIALSIIALLIFIPLLLREYFRRKSHDESILHGK
ncbi:MAG: YfhO family protein, partial [Fidelibacterota bacterium]